MRKAIPLQAADIQGLARLAVDGFDGTAALVEHLHSTIARVPLVSAVPESGRTRGVTGAVYASIRGVSGLVGGTLNRVFEYAVPRFGTQATSREREQWLAVVNGILGDHLAATGNPLAIPTRLCHTGNEVTGDDLSAIVPAAGARVLIAVHGLCMNPLSWANPQTGDAGLPAELADRLGYTRLDLHYNSGRHVSETGVDFAERLERLLASWPVPVEEIVIIGHSMGGLVARSAAHYGLEAGHRWPQRLTRMVFLGVPHHGAALEQAGNRIDRVLGISAYSRPFARLGHMRSVGITDLRHGSIRHEDWQDRDRFAPASATVAPGRLPAATRCLAVAGSLSPRSPGGDPARLSGDGLVGVGSALGQSGGSDSRPELLFERRRVMHNTGHLGLLERRAVRAAVSRWLREPRAGLKPHS